MCTNSDDSNWYGCYSKGWQGELVPDAFAHPAKVSRGLAKRIYQHCVDEGWIKEGSVVLDPFAGIGGFAYHALQHGVHFVGVELEEKFVDLATQNIHLWESRYGNGRFRTWGTAVVIQGDSRELGKVLAGKAEATISSPPYSETPIAVYDGSMGDKWRETGETPRQRSGGKLPSEQYNIENPDNLGNMPSGDLSAAISSPPYAESVGSDDPDKRGGLFRDERRRTDKTLTATYGESEGQLGAMSGEGFDGAVSSPPWEQTGVPVHEGQTDSLKGGKFQGGGEGFLHKDYGTDKENLGNQQSDTFWSAAKTIIEQCYDVLKPGAHAVFVVKSFVRNKKIVDFPDQWKRLCEAVGFKTVHVHKAWLIEERGSQYDLFGELHTKTVERKSFFRRLAEQKGSPRIDYEIVLCMEKE